MECKMRCFVLQKAYFWHAKGMVSAIKTVDLSIENKRFLYWFQGMNANLC